MYVCDIEYEVLVRGMSWYVHKQPLRCMMVNDPDHNVRGMNVMTYFILRQHDGTPCTVISTISVIRQAAGGGQLTPVHRENGDAKA
jgi:hypothetical protein